jgi:hypothetical protein
MTTPALAALLMTALAGQLDLSGLTDEIQQNGYVRVAVCPRPIITKGSDRTSVDDIAMLATEQVEQITQQLIDESGGQYKVVDPETAFTAIKGLRIDDLNNPDVRRQIGRQTGAEAMLFVFAEENVETAQWDLLFKLVELEDSTVAIQARRTLDLILSDAAYMGESFEARRWGPNGIEVVGFDPELPREWAMGVGADWERLQYASLKQVKEKLAAEGKPLPHPLENMQLPYGIELVVNGQSVAPERICDKLYVAIDPAEGPPGQGPDIGIRMFNQSGHKVFMAIYIDGVNMINQQRELPYLTPTGRHWSVRHGYDVVLRNWYHLEGGLSQQSKFQLVDAPQSVGAQTGLPPGGEDFVAFGDRIDDRLGMITCMVYTHGWEGVDANAEPPRTMGLKGQYGFGEGVRENTQIRWEAGERGILLAAMTLHYRTPYELDQIRAAGCDEQQPAAPPAIVQPQTVPDAAEAQPQAAQLQPTQPEAAELPAQPQRVQPQPEATTAGTGQPQPTDADLPGEDAPFPVAD